jgi:pyridinium-3,5-bisthiocarboxylic acid mononucleotide nickel chelatase
MTSMHLHIDPVGGIAGDMMVAALADLLGDPGIEASLPSLLRSAGLAGDVDVGLAAHTDGILRGRRFLVRDPRELGNKPVVGKFVLQTPAHAHAHHPHAQLQQQISGSLMSDGAKQRASDILLRLARAEAHVHGIALSEVAFHEVGAQDSMADVCTAAILLDRLAPLGHTLTTSVGSLPTGSGMVKTSHGELPVPAPATLELLQGMRMHDDGRAGERVTPTGAAILMHLVPQARVAGVARGVGIGFGMRTFSGISNVVRIARFDVSTDSKAWNTRALLRLSFDVDDQTSEDLAIGIDRLRARADVIDVTTTPVLGKKGRLAMCVQVLCDEAARDDVASACFLETTTLGIRVESLVRFELPRTAVVVDGMAAKDTLRPDGRTTRKLEAESLRSLTEANRTQRRQQAGES